MLSVEQLSPAQRRLNLLAVTAALTGTSLIYGLSVPLLALVLAERGVEDSLIGLSTAAQSVAIVLVSPLLPALLARHGPAIVMLLATGASVGLFLLLPVFEGYGAWLLLRFALGAAGSVIWVAGEAWVNQVALEATRGRVVALYGTAVTAGFALGPLLLSCTGTEGRAPFLLAGAVLALSALPLLPVLRVSPQLGGERRGPLAGYFLVAPVAMLCCLLFAVSDGMMLTFLPLYGLRLGLAETQAIQLVTVWAFGGILSQLPVGWLADRMDRRLLAALCVLGSGLGALLMPALVTVPVWNWVYMFLFGAVLAGVYTLALVLIGERFRGADLAAAAAVFGVMWGVGSVLGPPIGGLAMEHFPPHGLPWALALVFLAFAPWPALGWWRRRGARDYARTAPPQAGPPPG